MFLDMVRLEIGPFVPSYSQPVEAVNNAVNRFFCRTFDIGILDSEYKRAVMFLGKEPVIYGSPGSTYMKITGRARGKAQSDL